MPTYRSVLVPTDGSDGANAAVGHAVDLAAAHGATLHALYVVDETYPAMAEYDPVVEAAEAEGEQAVEAVEARAREAGVAVEKHLRRGVPHEEIVDAVGAYDADLVVVGAKGRTGVDRLLHPGSVTTRLLRLSPVPVFVVTHLAGEAVEADPGCEVDEETGTDPEPGT